MPPKFHDTPFLGGTLSWQHALWGLGDYNRDLEGCSRLRHEELLAVGSACPKPDGQITCNAP